MNGTVIQRFSPDVPISANEDDFLTVECHRRSCTTLHGHFCIPDLIDFANCRLPRPIYDLCVRVYLRLSMCFYFNESDQTYILYVASDRFVVAVAIFNCVCR